METPPFDHLMSLPTDPDTRCFKQDVTRVCRQLLTMIEGNQKAPPDERAVCCRAIRQACYFATGEIL